MEKDDTVYLRHVLEAINTIEEYLQGVHEDKFKGTRRLQDGVIRQIEIIGEAIRHISKDIRKANPEFPWQAMAGMRDKLLRVFFLARSESLPNERCPWPLFALKSGKGA
jgi:uncharacterized protein with HEPN domain